MAYTRTTWQNGPGGGTPLNAANLNKLEAAVVSTDSRLGLLETGKAKAAAGANLSVGWMFQTLAERDSASTSLGPADAGVVCVVLEDA